MYEHDNGMTTNFLNQNIDLILEARAQHQHHIGAKIPLDQNPLGFLGELLGDEAAEELDNNFKATKKNTDSKIVKFGKAHGIE